MSSNARLALAEIEPRVCDVVAGALGIPRQRISPRTSLLEDLGVDSLDIVELTMELEETFSVTLPDEAPNAVYKAVFTRQPFRLCDFAELVYLQQGTGTPERKSWRRALVNAPTAPSVPFTQLDGRWQANDRQSIFERLKTSGPTRQYRRRSDGMRCVLVPSDAVELGCEAPDSCVDERPKRVVKMDAFLIDAEPVSTTAYCRFLNSMDHVSPKVLGEWFQLDPEDDRNEHMLIGRTEARWQAAPGTERWPMILVSWYGANAYSLWCNGRDWRGYRDTGFTEADCLLPTEAQWEYAARGPRYQPFPWGASDPSQDRMRYGQHRQSRKYRANSLPMANVNELLGMSPFGLHHMAGNVWQWCRDWYAENFYERAEAQAANPVNQTATRVRSERGGSWIGPADLCRSSYRRGRPPLVRGRCLGFRCISSVKDLL